MDAEMLAFFPNGIRALLVDDDSNFLKSATIMLSKFQYKVVTCGSPASGMKLLSSERVKDVDVVLVDGHRVSVCGFDLCTRIENDLHIPLIYFMSSTAENPAAGSNAQSSSRLARLVQSASYIIKRPFDAGELRGLWRAVAWRKCVLENARRAKECINLLGDINGVGAEHMNNHGGDIDRSARSSESRKQQIVWTPGLKKKFENAFKYVGTGGHPSEILEHMNVKGLRRHHVASYLQQYRARLELDKKNDRCGGAPPPSPRSYNNSPPEGSPVIRSILPAPNPRILTGSAWPSNVIDLDAGENDATAALPSSWACQESSENNVIPDTRAPAMLPKTVEQQTCNVAATALAGGNGAPASLPSWSPSCRNPVGGDVSSSSAAPAEAVLHVAEEQQPPCNATASLPLWDVIVHQPTEDLSSIIALQESMQGDAAPIDQNIFFDPFTDQDHQFLQGEEEQQQVILVDASAADVDGAAEMVAELVAASTHSFNGLAVPPYGDGEIGGAVATAGASSYNAFAQLEAFLLLDESVSIDGSTASNGTRAMMNGDEGSSGTKTSNLGIDHESAFLDEILRDNSGDDAPE